MNQMNRSLVFLVLMFYLFNKFSFSQGMTPNNRNLNNTPQLKIVKKNLLDRFSFFSIFQDHQLYYDYLDSETKNEKEDSNQVEEHMETTATLRPIKDSRREFAFFLRMG